jgi:hypothetical protein
MNILFSTSCARFVSVPLYGELAPAHETKKISSFIGGLQQSYCSEANFPRNYSLHPDWITGFTDGEGSFIISLAKYKSNPVGYIINPLFQIKLNIRDLELLKRIQDYFGGCGKIYIEKNKAKFVVFQHKELVEIIIPHFLKYPLLTKKWSDFELFRQILLIMTEGNGYHYTKEGFSKILQLRYNLNKGISEELKGLYPNLIPVDRPLVPERNISSEWLVGFVDAEGSLNVITVEKLTSSSTTPVSRKVWLYFQITQHGRDILLLERIVTFFGCGKIRRRNTAIFDTCDYTLSKFEDIESIIIPFFKKYPLQSAKLFDLQCFIDAAGIIKQKSGRSWTLEQFNKVKSIQIVMNKYTKKSTNNNE